jgi:GTPase SAR1 family protein
LWQEEVLEEKVVVLVVEQVDLEKQKYLLILIQIHL